MKVDKLLDACSYLLSRGDTGYSSTYPYNCLYYTGSVLYADCNNYIKSLLNSDCEAAYNYTAGQFYQPPSAALDWDCGGLINHCSDISTDMTNILPGECLYMNGSYGQHVGIYYGNGKVCEFTTV